MRLIAFVLAALAVSGPASAEWKEFNSVSEGFGVVFPADPDVEEVTMFEVVPGKMVPARIYSARYDNSLFKMTVVEGRECGPSGNPGHRSSPQATHPGWRVEDQRPSPHLSDLWPAAQRRTG